MLRSDAGVVGKAEVAGSRGGWYYLRLDDRTTHKQCVRATDLRPVGFELRQLPATHELCAAALDGALACLTWEKEPGGGRFVPFACRLRAEADGQSLIAEYFDDASDNERLYVAVRPTDRAPESGDCGDDFVAFRADGTELSFGTEGQDNMIHFDAARLRHAAAIAAASAEVLEVDERADLVSEVTVETETCPLRSLLAEARLGEYAEAFIEAGYDDADYLRSMSDAHAEEMARRTRMKPGHLMRFRSSICHGPLGN